jgi:hypothetical protein
MTARWYIVHAYSNFEKKVAEDIENQAGARAWATDRADRGADRKGRRGAPRPQGRCRAQVLPRLRAGARELTDEVFSLIKNTPKVTGFLGDSKPVPITDARPSVSCIRCRRASSGRSRRSPSRSARRCASPTVPSPPSPARAGSRRGALAAQGRSVDLRARRAGGSGIRSGRKGLTVWPACRFRHRGTRTGWEADRAWPARKLAAPPDCKAGTSGMTKRQKKNG